LLKQRRVSGVQKLLVSVVRDTALEQKLLNTQPLLGVRPLPRGRNVYQHQLRKEQEGVERSTLRPYGAHLLGDGVNVTSKSALAWA